MEGDEDFSSHELNLGAFVVPEHEQVRARARRRRTCIC